MNILVIAHYGLQPKLSASFVYAQAKAYAELGHKVRMIIPIPFGKEYKGHYFLPKMHYHTEENIELYYIRHLSISNYGRKWFNSFSAQMALQPYLKMLFHEFTPDIIHSHTLGFDCDLGVWLKEKLNCPLVVTAHGTDVFRPFNQGEKLLLKQNASQADKIVCVSNLLKNTLIKCSVPERDLHTILNGFQIQNAADIQNKRPYSIIQSGYLVPRKKADITIRALKLLSERYPDITMDIVGSGSEMERFQALAAELNLSDSISFHGFLPNADNLDLMAKSKFFVMPSINEGFGIVYLEAMANGCITIGTEGEGIADLIVHGKNGFLVPPDDPEAIVNVIDWCIAHPEEAAAIAECGRRDALALTWEKNACECIALFQELINV